jgi:hypothetical protein
MTARSAGPEGSDGCPVTSAKWVEVPALAKEFPVRMLLAKVRFVFRYFSHLLGGVVSTTPVRGSVSALQYPSTPDEAGGNGG